MKVAVSTIRNVAVAIGRAHPDEVYKVAAEMAHSFDIDNAVPGYYASFYRDLKRMAKAAITSIPGAELDKDGLDYVSR